MKTILNQQGFTAIEGILILVIAVIIGGTGYYVYHSSQQTDKNLQSANTDAKFAKQKEDVKQDAQPTQVDDKTAILTAIKNYTTERNKNEPDAQAITFTYGVDEITGNNAKGTIVASLGDPGVYYAQKQNNVWQIIYSGHLQPRDDAICLKYALPAAWCGLY